MQHDYTVAAMLSVFNMYNGLLPPFASAFIIELYNDTNSNKWVWTPSILWSTHTLYTPAAVMHTHNVIIHPLDKGTLFGSYTVMRLIPVILLSSHYLGVDSHAHWMMSNSRCLYIEMMLHVHLMWVSTGSCPLTCWPWRMWSRSVVCTHILGSGGLKGIDVDWRDS